MATHCVNHKHPEIIELAKNLQMHEAVVSSKVALWQERTGIMDRYPTLLEMQSEAHDILKVTQKRDEVVNRLLENGKTYKKELVANEKIKGVKKELLDSSGFTERYIHIPTGDIIYKRVTDKQSELFIQKKGKSEAERINNLPDNIIKRDKASEIHAVNEAILTNILNASTSKFISKVGIKDKPVYNKEQIKKIANLTDAQYQVLEDNINKLVEQIVQQQKNINPNGQVVILSEALLIDKADSLGGSTDIVSLFSDNSASIYDYKNITPNKEYLDGNKNLIKNPIPNYKRDSYNVQMAKYKEILKSVYGVEKVRETRVIPIKLEYKLKPKTDRSIEKGFLSNTLVNIQMGEHMNPWLRQLPLAFEETGDKSLDTLISHQERIIHNLEKKEKDTYLTTDERIRLERLHDSIVNLRLKKDYRTTLNDIRKVVVELVGKDQMSGRLAIDDKDNPLYMGTKELLIYLEDLAVYKTLGANFKNVLLDLAEADKKSYFEEKETINKLVGAVTDTMSELEEKLLQRISEIAESKGENISELDTIDVSIFSRLSQVDHPVFKTFYKLLSERQHQIRKNINELDKDISEAIEGITSFDLLINDNTGNMHSRISKDFWNERDNAIANRDFEWFQKHYEVQQKYKDNYEIRLRNYRSKLELKFDDEFEINKKLDRWIEQNNPNKLQYWFGGESKWQTRIKDEYVKKYKSEEFKAIEANPTMLKFYELVEKKNQEFRGLLGLGRQELPDNFLPNMRKEIVEKLLHGEFSATENFNEFVDGLKIKESTDGSKIKLSVDPTTGENINTIPQFYIKPIFNEEGKIDPKLKTRELGTALLLFGKMAYTYQDMSAIESDVDALSYTLEKGKIETLQLNSRGNKFKDFTGDWAKKLGVDTNAVDKFKAWQNYYIYNIKIDASMIKNDELIKGTDISKTKVLLAAKNYLAAKLLAVNVIPAMGAYGASRINLHYEAVKGQYFTTENSNDATVSLTKEWKKYHALAEFIEAYADDATELKANNLKLSNVSKWVNMDTLMAPYRHVDKRIDSQITNAMARNWGVDEKGTIMRMDKLTKHFAKLNEEFAQRGLKKTLTPRSIWELSQMSEKSDEFKIEGLSEEGFIMFRNAVRKAKSNITGLMTAEDINNANINLYMNLVMQFKNWMPGMYSERFGSIKYDKDLDLVDQGKYNVLAGELFRGKKEDESYAKFVGMMASSAFKMALDISTFGIPKSLLGYNFYKINEEKARIEYAEYLKEHPSYDPERNNGKGMSYEDFVEMKQNQLASGLAEFRMLLVIMGLIFALGGDWDDDGKKDYRKYWATRQMFKIINRTQMELGFSTNPNDFIKLVQTPLPLVRLLLDIYSTFGNTLDETRDILFGENSTNDKTPISYYSSQWVVGVKGTRRVFDMFYEKDSENPY